MRQGFIYEISYRLMNGGRNENQASRGSRGINS